MGLPQAAMALNITEELAEGVFVRILLHVEIETPQRNPLSCKLTV